MSLCGLLLSYRTAFALDSPLFFGTVPGKGLQSAGSADAAARTAIRSSNLTVTPVHHHETFSISICWKKRRSQQITIFLPQEDRRSQYTCYKSQHITSDDRRSLLTTAS